jgi:hypothetical protein
MLGVPVVEHSLDDSIGAVMGERDSEDRQRVLENLPLSRRIVDGHIVRSAADREPCVVLDEAALK